MPAKPVAVVGAMLVEFLPLVAKLKAQKLDGVLLYELPTAAVVIGGIGEKYARRATEIAIAHAQPRLVVSAGIAGAISGELRIGDVGHVREIVEVPSGQRYATSNGGDWLLATSQDVSDAIEKQELLTKYGADVVDMEGAAVAEVAKQHQLDFAAIKAISDDAQFQMPPLNKFIKDGKFDTRRFLVYISLHPQWWGALAKIKRYSHIATENLCREVGHLIQQAAG
jgi:adenosylhomocysteine nucleosidase